MNTNKSFSTETSDRYSLALFELSEENSNLDIVEKNMGELLQLYNTNLDIKNFIKNPTQAFEDQLNLISKITEIMKFDTNLKNFLSILVIKRRIFFLEKIIISFLKLCAKKRGELTATLVSSKKLTNEEIENISLELSKSIGSKIFFNYKVNEDLIGGLKIQLGSLMIDSSIKNKLKKYEQLMTEN